MHNKYLGLLVSILGLYLQSHAMERDLCKPTFPVEQQARTAWIDTVLRPLIKNSIVERMYKDTVPTISKLSKISGTFAQKVFRANTYTPKIDLVKPDAYIQEAQFQDWYFFSMATGHQINEESWSDFISTFQTQFDTKKSDVYILGYDSLDTNLYKQCLIKENTYKIKEPYLRLNWPFTPIGAITNQLIEKVLKDILISLQGIDLELQNFSNPYDPWLLLEIIQEELLRAKIIDEKVNLIYLAYYFYPAINTFGSLENIEAFLNKYSQNDKLIRYSLWRTLLCVGIQVNQTAVFKLFFEQATIAQEFRELDTCMSRITQYVLGSRHSEYYCRPCEFSTEDIECFLLTNKNNDYTEYISVSILDLLLCATRWKSTNVALYILQNLVYNPDLYKYCDHNPSRLHITLRFMLYHAIENNDQILVNNLLHIISPTQPLHAYSDIIKALKCSQKYICVASYGRKTMPECQELLINKHPLTSNSINESYFHSLNYILSMESSQILLSNPLIIEMMGRRLWDFYDYYLKVQEQPAEYWEPAGALAREGMLLLKFFQAMYKQKPTDKNLHTIIYELHKYTCSHHMIYEILIGKEKIPNITKDI